MQIKSLRSAAVSARLRVLAAKALFKARRSSSLTREDYILAGRDLATRSSTDNLDDFVAHARGWERFPADTEWLYAFHCYCPPVPGTDPIRLLWWDRPAPGNFGDWLSPYILARISGRPIQYVDPLGSKANKHAIGIGSIAKYATANADVLGAGVIAKSEKVDPRAKYRFVRGPYTASAINASGGEVPELFGDYGVLIRLAYNKDVTAEGGTGAFVRHYADQSVRVKLPSYVEEISIHAAGPDKIESFIDRIRQKTFVITTAMHCMIACHSYGIPCFLVRLDDQSRIIGDGVKYLDYAAGMNLRPSLPPVVGTDLANTDLYSMCEQVVLPESRLSQLRGALEQYASER